MPADLLGSFIMRGHFFSNIKRLCNGILLLAPIDTGYTLR